MRNGLLIINNEAQTRELRCIKCNKTHLASSRDVGFKFIEPIKCCGGDIIVEEKVFTSTIKERRFIYKDKVNEK